MTVTQVASKCNGSSLPPECLNCKGDVASSSFHVKSPCTGLKSHLQVAGLHTMRINHLLDIPDHRSTTPCGCDANIAASLKLRQRLGDVKRPVKVPARLERVYKSALGSLYKDCSRAVCHIAPLTPEQIPDRYSGAQRAAYVDSLALYHRGFVHSVGCVMNKWGERCGCDARSRAIIPQYMRDPDTGRFLPVPILAELPSRLLLEEALHRQYQGTNLVYASARSLQQRANDIKALMKAGWVCISIDCSSFDGSLGDLAVWEREYLLKFAKRHGCYTPQLAQTINQQNRLPLRTRGGSKGVLKKNRQSGTAGTSTGNKVCMMAALKAAFGPMYEKVCFYCDGDDTLLFLPPELVSEFDDCDDPLGPSATVRSWMKRLDRMGLETKIENVAFKLEDIIFCRSKVFTFSDGTATMAKIPTDAYKTQTCIVRHFKGGQLIDYLTTLRRSFDQLWQGIPILGCIGKMFPNTGTVDNKLMATTGIERWALKGTQLKQREVDDHARAQFALVFGIPAGIQRQVEELLTAIGDNILPVLRAFKVNPRPLCDGGTCISTSCLTCSRVRDKLATVIDQPLKRRVNVGSYPLRKLTAASQRRTPPSSSGHSIRSRSPRCDRLITTPVGLDAPITRQIGVLTCVPLRSAA